MVKVSIVVPVYNVEQYLDECLQSILMQTYDNYEVIIVNDGSTDNSLNICYKYKEQSDKIKIYTKNNGGLSSARNYGIERSDGEYIIFIDSDDFWIKDNVLENLVSIALSTNAEIVRGEYKEVDENGNDLYIPKELEVIKDIPLTNSIFVKEVLCNGHFSWLFLIKRITLQNFRFSVNQKFQEDIEFNIRYFATPRICVYTPFRFYAYRKRRNSIMSTLKVDNLKYSFLLSDIWYKYSERISDENLSKIYCNNSIMMYYWTLETMSQIPYYDNRLYLIKELSLTELNKRVCTLAISTKTVYPLPIYMSPQLGIFYFRLRHKLGELLRKFRIL